MKPLFSKTILLTVALVAMTSYTVIAQRVIKGTVYRGGEPAAGVTVEAHRSSGTFMTSFDGKYEIEVSDKSKYIEFTFIDDRRKLDIEGNNSNVINLVSMAKFLSKVKELLLKEALICALARNW
jgi:hypothetical protein